MLKISGLFVYPIKSLGGIALHTAQVCNRGLEHDRRWMLVDENNRFLSQREIPEMALLQVEFVDNGLWVMHQQQAESSIFIPFMFDAKEAAVCTIWDDKCLSEFVDREIDAWFTEMLQLKCRLVYMPKTTLRQVDQQYAQPDQVTSFADAYPFLMVGQASLDELNGRLPEAVPMDRFRPNIVFTGGTPFQEDQMQHFTISNINFYGVKPCARCPVITINQENGIIGKEPLKTLAGYRKKNNKVYFGQNLVHDGEGVISIGDEINIKELKPEKFI
ncbi:MOSC domain-containing protein [Mucilaginibacter arboris]|uniref:MOSC domain-containing protein n=1 Tax=Mucilaginibacter arboris TaxID=2682090 RepID=A0A7K1SWX7_9SPHI|nr:MOSC N-terminal beta barrel domain-containing protein [Mucilaginibacter arboris]MVN21804.1 MOSC domain-containing protein [Mucilaginibacter arboris]